MRDIIINPFHLINFNGRLLVDKDGTLLIVEADAVECRRIEIWYFR